MKQYTGDKYKNKGASVQTGVSECSPIEKETPRGEGQGQRPNAEGSVINPKGRKSKGY